MAKHGPLRKILLHSARDWKCGRCMFKLECGHRVPLRGSAVINFGQRKARCPECWKPQKKTKQIRTARSTGGRNEK